MWGVHDGGRCGGGTGGMGGMESGGEEGGDVGGWQVGRNCMASTRGGKKTTVIKPRNQAHVGAEHYREKALILDDRSLGKG